MDNFTPLKIENTIKSIETPIAVTSQNLPIIRKEAKYNKLKKLIKEGKYISARITAKAIGISKDTILDWMKTPAIQKAVQSEIDISVEVMKKSEDWRSHDRLIQYAIGSDDKQAGQGSNILIINNGKEYRIEEQTG